uniref:Uncharacterized protein n=1 Tax=Phytophthora ramorum TaxID=164328 RepID=H3HB92_PHYRM
MSERGRSRSSSSERRNSHSHRRSPSRSPRRRRSHKHRRHEEREEEPAEKLKLQNREEVAHRSRMWTVVDSDEDGTSSSRRETNRDSSDDERSHRKRKHKRSSSHKDRKRHKKDKKKSSKKTKKDSKKHAVNQDEYGKYGILRELDFHNKSVSFQAWLRDVKKMGEFNGPKWEAMELFKEYMKDYNTCTLPHEKYYDIEKYEMKLYQKQQRKALTKQKGASDKAVDTLADEERVRRERQTAREKKEQDEFRLVLQLMDKDKIEAMREQERLRSQMQLMYKSGDVGEARRLEQILNKVDEDPRFKR